MAVPPGHVAHFPPLEHLVAVDEVFQDLPRAAGQREVDGGGWSVTEAWGGATHKWTTSTRATQGGARAFAGKASIVLLSADIKGGQTLLFTLGVQIFANIPPLLLLLVYCSPWS